MIEAVLDIKRWGNNLGVRLPAAVAREAHLHVDQRVRVSVEGDHVLITPVDDSRFTLDNAWLPMIQSATAASRWPRHKRWAPNVGSGQTRAGGPT